MVIALLAAAVAASTAADGASAPPGRDPALLHRHVAQLAVEKEREQEGTLRKLLALGGPDGEQAEVLARLANLLRARSLAVASEANTIDDQQRGDSLRERANAARGEAIARYRELLKKYPAAERLDEALFFLADSLQEAGDDKGAVAAARELTRRFPKSRRAPDAHVFVGDHLFETARLDEALAEYRAAAKEQAAEVYPYAIYKAAWCRFNQKAFAEALALLRKVIDVSEQRAGHKDSGDPTSKVQLVREARRDYVLVYARAGKAEDAWKDFSTFGEKPARKMLDGYARLLVDAGRDPEAQIVYAKLLDLHSDDSAHAALDRARLLAISARTGGPNKRAELLDGARQFHAAIEKARAFKPNDEDNKDAVAQAEKIGEEQLRMLSVNLHSEARKVMNGDTFAAAKALYTHYLALFPKTEASYELRFYAAELSYETGEKPQAAALYEEVTKLDLAALKAKQKPGKHLLDAAWGAVLSRDEALKDGGEVNQSARAQKHGEASGGEAGLKPLDEGEKLLAAACALYLEALPEGPKAVEVAYRLGRLEIRDKKLDAATAHLSAIALVHPEHELAEFAANLTVDIANLKKDFPAVQAWAVKFLRHGKLTQKRPALESALITVEEQSAYAIAAGTKEDAAQAKALLAFVDAHKSGKLVDKALFGAAAALSRAGKIDQALSARARLFAEQSGSTLVPRALLASAADHAVVGDFGEAAAYSEKYALGFRKQEDTRRWRLQHPSTTKRPPQTLLYDADKARAALHDAAVLREARGELKQALMNRQLSLKTWPGGPDADEDAIAAASLKAKTGELTNAAREFTSLAHKFAGKPALQIQAWRESARLYARLRQADHATWAWMQLEKAWGHLNAKQREAADGAAEAAAEAHLELGKRAFEEFQKQQIKPPLQATLQRKIALMNRVKKRGEETVAMRQAGPAVCALVQLGEAQLSMSQAIEHSPVPPALRSADQRKLYRAALEEQWKPIRDGAEETLREAEAKAREMGIGNQACAAKARAVLEKMGAPAQAAAPELSLPAAKQPTPAWVDADGRPVKLPGQPARLPLKASGEPDAHSTQAAQIGGEGVGTSGDQVEEDR